MERSSSRSGATRTPSPPILPLPPSQGSRATATTSQHCCCRPIAASAPGEAFTLPTGVPWGHVGLRAHPCPSDRGPCELSLSPHGTAAVTSHCSSTRTPQGASRTGWSLLGIHEVPGRAHPLFSPERHSARASLPPLWQDRNHPNAHNKVRSRVWPSQLHSRGDEGATLLTYTLTTTAKRRIGWQRLVSSVGMFKGLFKLPKLGARFHPEKFPFATFQTSVPGGSP